MPLRIKCPTGHTLIVPDDRAGRTLKCPRCDQPVVVPGGQTDAASEALLSVLAEGIPAASLAAGSLKVASAPTPVFAPAQRTVEPVADDKPPKLPVDPQVPRRVVKPKSRVLPAAAAKPAPPKADPELAVPPAPLVPVEQVKFKPATIEPEAAEPVNFEPPPIAQKAAPVESQPEVVHSLPSIEPAQSPPLPEPAALPSEATVAQPPAAEDAAEQIDEPEVKLPAESVVHDEAATAESSQPPPIAAAVAAEEPARGVEPVEVAHEPPTPAIREAVESVFAPPVVDHEPAPPPFVLQPATPVTASLAADAARTLAAYQLAVALAAAALFSVVPAVWDVVEFLRTADSTFVARWALAVFFLGVVQLAYAVYLFQLPDWTTVFVVTLFSLALAAVYAAVLGLVLLSPPDGFLVGNGGLQLADKLAGGKAALWCLCMISLSTILAFFAGRLGSTWHRAELMLRVAAA